jgi:DNA/RNA endonuclease YhcR with UshA esterase domain
MTNSKNHVLLIIMLIAGILLFFSACRTILIDSGSHDNGTVKPHKPDHNPPPKPEKGISKGDVITVTGRVERNGNQYYIHDVNSSRTFRIVSLGQHEKNALYKREGDVVKIRLKVVSVESKFSYVTEFITLY